MKHDFSPSINILRDATKSIEYFPTKNSRNIYQQISANFPRGIHSFNVVGSYGTGKSAFLLALSKHLAGEREIFSPVNGQFNGCKKFRFIKIIGQAQSLIQTFAEELGVDADEKSVLDCLKKEHNRLKKSDVCLVLIIDEFGKLLEYAAKNDPDRELYLIQQLAEYANDSRRNFLLITTLHQNFEAYAIGLADTQRKEWAKVKGRLTELTFNEPFEQLLHLAADFIANRKFAKPPKISKTFLDKIGGMGIFKMHGKVSKAFVKKIYPFDLLSAMALTISLQKYGQNERSLFNFLETDELFGLNTFHNQEGDNPYYNLSCVYQYLQHNYYSILTSRYNPDYFKWSIIRNSLDRIELELTKDIANAQKIIQTIGLLDLLGSNAVRIDRETLVIYGEEALGISNTAELIMDLEAKKIIRYQNFRSRYKLFEGTDIDVEQLQRKAKKEIDPQINVAEELKEYFEMTHVPAKAITYQKGTPRIFKFELSEEPIKTFVKNAKEIDGLINIVFKERLSKSNFLTHDEPILYGHYKNSGELSEQLLEIRAIDKALVEVEGDRIAKRELIELRGHLRESINQSVNNQLFGNTSNVRWYYEGKVIRLKKRKSFNQQLSIISQDIYRDTPNYHNELMNKTKVSSSIHHAKNQYVKALVEQWNNPNLGFPEKAMPPEKTIFYSLLKNTGLHKDINPFAADFDSPGKESSFYKLWQASEQFLLAAQSGRRPLTEFIKMLSHRPFGLKEGFIEFWLITFLFIKREEYALYKDGKYVPRFTIEVGGQLFKEAKKYELKTFDIRGVKLDLYNKYRDLTLQDSSSKFSESGFQAMARPFLVFYNDLSSYTQQTRSLSLDTLSFRKVICNAKELEKTFFEDLPTCLGYTLDQLSASRKSLNEFVSRINVCITALRTAEEVLINRIEEHICKILGWKKRSFAVNKKKIQSRYSNLKKHLLNPRQKTFFSRINSQLPDKSAWISSLVQALIGKLPSNITDEEEQIIYDRFSMVFQELDNLLELSQMSYDEKTEDVLKIEITQASGNTFKKNIILSKEQKRGAKAFEKRLRKTLSTSKDQKLTQVLLIKLLKEISSDEKD